MLLADDPAASVGPFINGACPSRITAVDAYDVGAPFVLVVKHSCFFRFALRLRASFLFSFDFIAHLKAFQRPTSLTFARYCFGGILPRPLLQTMQAITSFSHTESPPCFSALT